MTGARGKAVTCSSFAAPRPPKPRLLCPPSAPGPPQRGLGLLGPSQGVCAPWSGEAVRCSPPGGSGHFWTKSPESVLLQLLSWRELIVATGSLRAPEAAQGTLPGPLPRVAVTFQLGRVCGADGEGPSLPSPLPRQNVCAANRNFAFSGQLTSGNGSTGPRSADRGQDVGASGVRGRLGRGPEAASWP